MGEVVEGELGAGGVGLSRFWGPAGGGGGGAGVLPVSGTVSWPAGSVSLWGLGRVVDVRCRCGARKNGRLDTRRIIAKFEEDRRSGGVRDGEGGAGVAIRNRDRIGEVRICRNCLEKKQVEAVMVQDWVTSAGHWSWESVGIRTRVTSGSQSLAGDAGSSVSVSVVAAAVPGSVGVSEVWCSPWWGATTG